jgi:hypothetical protein
MNRLTHAVLIAVAVGLATLASAQTGVQESSQTSVHADGSHAQASEGTSAEASTQSGRANAGPTAGAAFNARLDSTIDSKKNKPGDPITARTTESVKSEGETVLPKGTKLVGHVTQASARARGDAESVLAVTFDHAVLKNGRHVPLAVAIQAVASGHSAVSAEEGDSENLAFMDAGAASSTMAGGRGVVGGLTSSAGGALGSFTLAPALNSTVGSATTVAGASHGAVGGLNAAGHFTSDSRGVFGLHGLSLGSATSGGMDGTLITSAGKNVRLDSGTRMLLVTRTNARTRLTR